MNTELLRKVTKVHTPDGVYDGSVCHEAADEIERLNAEVKEMAMQSISDSCQCQMHMEEIDRLVRIMGEISVNRDDHELVGKLAEQAITEK